MFPILLVVMKYGNLASGSNSVRKYFHFDNYSHEEKLMDSYDPDSFDLYSQTHKLSDEVNITQARNLMHIYNLNASDFFGLIMEVKWDLYTNITERNKHVSEEVSLVFKKYQKSTWNKFRQFHWETFEDSDLQRMFKLVSILGREALENKDYKEMVKISQDMEILKNTLTVCSYEEPTICNNTYKYVEHLYKTYPPDEARMRFGWLQVHNTVGKEILPLYKKLVKYLNKAAKLNAFEDNSEMIIHEYEMENFIDELNSIWKQIQPLYWQLHTYVRRKLIQVYGSDLIQKYIPAHLTGDVMGWNWMRIENITKPFPHIKSMDLTNEMLRQNLTVMSLCRTAENFFVSLGFEKMTDKFWNNSIFEKPLDKQIICSGTAWNMHRKDDYRVIMCSEVSMSDFFAILHEMGHIQYFVEYKNQHLIYRNAPNPAFHEAIGDTLALSASTPSYLKKIRLLSDFKHTEDEEISHLYFMALQHLPLMAYTLFFDSWQWKVFQGNITEDEYNSKWWEMRQNYQGVSPPVTRTDEDFDAGNDYHLASGSGVIVYFISRILQFQFHRSLCKEAYEYVPGNSRKPLHKCNIYNNKKAGMLLRKILRMGRSKTWSEVLYMITNGESCKLDASALLEYFQPLMNFLTEENRKNSGATVKNDSASIHALITCVIYSCLLIFTWMVYVL